MNDYELSRLWTGQPPRTSEDNPRVTAKDYGTMPIAEFVEGVFSTNNRDAARDVLAEVIDDERKRGDFFRDALHALNLCPISEDYPCKEGGVCLFHNTGWPNYAACWDEVERRQR